MAARAGDRILDEAASKPDNGAPPPRFSVNNIQIAGGRIDFDDVPLHEQHAVTDLDIALPSISNLPRDVEVYVLPKLTANIDGAPLAIKGRARPFEQRHDATLDIHFENVDLTRFVPYVPVDLKLKLHSALLGAKLRILFESAKDAPPRLKVSGAAALKQVRADFPEAQPLLNLDRLAIDVDFADITNAQYRISDIRLEGAELNLRRATNGALEILGLMPPASPQPVAKPAPGSTPLKLEVAALTIDGVRVNWLDAQVGQDIHLSPLKLQARNLSLAAGTAADLEASIATTTGETLSINGRLSIEPLAFNGRMQLSKLQPANFSAYYRDAVLFRVLSGTADVVSNIKARFDSTSTQAELSGLGARIADLALQRPDQKAPFLSLAKFELVDGDFDLAKQSVTLGSVSLDGTKLIVTRDAKGEVDLASLLPPAPAGKVAAAQPKATPWSWGVRRLDLARAAIQIDDSSLASPATLVANDLELHATNLSSATAAESSIALSGSIGRRGRVAAKGSLVIEPLKADLDLDASGIDIVPLQPYFTEKLRVAITQGAVGARGRVSYAAPPTPQGSARMRFNGDLGVTSFAAFDKANGSDFLIGVGEIGLDDFYSRIIVSPAGRINLQDIVVTDAESTPGTSAAAGAALAPAARPPAREAPAPAQPLTAKIDRVILKGGNVDFSDRFIKPNYSANLTAIAGSVEGLSSQPGTTARVQLGGTVNDTAPLSIDGAINPLSGNLYLDLTARVHDFELSPASPYAAKYAGYGIDKGKLSLDVNYHIENGKLAARNRLVLDQLTFGERVESPTATKLPVLLAVSLLKDRHGVIDINLPVSGSLDDPDFSIGGIILKVIVNLLAKAATSPFALLSAAFGSGEELSYIEFPPGSATVIPAAESRLQGVAKALVERPALNLEIAGRSVAEVDAEAAKRLALEQKVRAQKADQMLRKGQAIESADALNIDSAEYPSLLKQVYQRESFSKPRNAIGLTRDLPVAEMERLILDNIPIGADEIRALAERRALVVKDWLIGPGKVPAERVFLVAPKMFAPGDGAPASRVDLSLK